MRYRLRTLLIVLALGPPLIWGTWEAEQYRRRQELRRLVLEIQSYSGESLLRNQKPALDYDRVQWRSDAP